MLGNMVMALAADATTYLPTAITGVNFNAVLAEITAVAPSILPVTVACIAFRKGISFIYSTLRGA